MTDLCHSDVPLVSLGELSSSCLGVDSQAGWTSPAIKYLRSLERTRSRTLIDVKYFTDNVVMVR